MKLERLPVLDQLAVADERCLGALFTTFTFEPAFFENHVLAAILRVGADPDEEAAAYHEEALALLQEAPIACFVDASMRVSGHQLPYDLREIRNRCFHPKVSLLLFGGFARLAVGSANLTKQGYGRNAETVFVRNLVYTEPEDVLVLREVHQFFEQLHQLATPEGMLTRAVLDTLHRRLQATPTEGTSPRLRFLHTETGEPVLAQLLGLLPETARITRIGVLAPFFERDDISPGGDLDVGSVLVALAKRAGGNAVLDLGAAWDDAPIAPSKSDPASIRDHLGALWARRHRAEDDEKSDKVRFFVPTAVTASNYRCVNHHGESKLWSREELDAEVEARTTWHVGTPRVFAPRNLIAAAREHVEDVRLWLHPGSQLLDSQPIERPLHAKLFTVAFQVGKKHRTLIVVGSANASRMALLATPNEAGNVEACVAFLVDDELSLRDVSPELTFCAAPVEWQERTFPELPPLPSVPDVESAVYSPREQALTITWAPVTRKVDRWRLSYLDIPLATGDGHPGAPTRVHPFRLSPSSCEVSVRAADGELTFPIIVDDLAALPLDGFRRELDLRELLALAGRRLSPARHKVIAQKHGAAVLDATLTSLLGENFSPTDVLRVWWTVAHDLGTPGLTLAGFRLRLLGTLGAAAVWRRLHELARVPRSGVRLEEAWFYGSELRRALADVELPDDPDRGAKRAVLDAFQAELVSQLATLRPPTDARPWVGEIIRFYEEPSS